MEKNIQDYNSFSDRLEKVLNNLGYSFRIVDLGDNDLNYILILNGKQSNILSLKKIDKISCLIYIDNMDKSLNFMAINLYRIQDKNDLENCYKLVNDVNYAIDHGKFSVQENLSNITYKAVIDYNEQYDIISEPIIKKIIRDFFYNLSYFLAFMNRMKRDEEK